MTCSLIVGIERKASLDSNIDTTNYNSNSVSRALISIEMWTNTKHSTIWLWMFKRFLMVDMFYTFYMIAMVYMNIDLDWF